MKEKLLVNRERIPNVYESYFEEHGSGSTRFLINRWIYENKEPFETALVQFIYEANRHVKCSIFQKKYSRSLMMFFVAIRLSYNLSYSAQPSRMSTLYRLRQFESHALSILRAHQATLTSRCLDFLIFEYP